ncbi:hypothetical protein D3C86_1750220 [compost metagenome]
MRQRLGKTKTRVKDDPFGSDTHFGARLDSLAQETCNLDRHIVVMGIVLHVVRLAKHMHQAHRQAGCSRCIQRTVAP